jgi:hypothetical protein
LIGFSFFLTSFQLVFKNMVAHVIKKMLWVGKEENRNPCNSTFLGEGFEFPGQWI